MGVGAIEQPAAGRAGRVRVAAFAVSLPLAFVVVLAAATRFSLLDHQYRSLANAPGQDATLLIER